MKNGLAAIPNQEEDVEIGHVRQTVAVGTALARDTAQRWSAASLPCLYSEMDNHASLRN